MHQCIDAIIAAMSKRHMRNESRGEERGGEGQMKGEGRRVRMSWWIGGDDEHMKERQRRMIR